MDPNEYGLYQQDPRCFPTSAFPRRWRGLQIRFHQVRDHRAGGGNRVWKKYHDLEILFDGRNP